MIQMLLGLVTGLPWLERPRLPGGSAGADDAPKNARASNPGGEAGPPVEYFTITLPDIVEMRRREAGEGA
jgi:hypothetical protein